METKKITIKFKESPRVSTVGMNLINNFIDIWWFKIKVIYLLCLYKI